MGFKEGVELDRVIWFKDLVDVAKKLQDRIYDAQITPDEAFEALDKAMADMTTPAKPEKYGPETMAKATKAVGTKSAA